MPDWDRTQPLRPTDASFEDRGYRKEAIYSSSKFMVIFFCLVRKIGVKISPFLALASLFLLGLPVKLPS